jgi:hypothetical protein
VQTWNVSVVEPNPFRIAGELLPGEMIDREDVTVRLFALAAGGFY